MKSLGKPTPFLRGLTAMVILVFLGLGLAWLLTPFTLRALRNRNPGETRMMEFRRQQARNRHQRFKVRQQWVALDKVSPFLKKAVLISEDDTFYEHGALDFSGIWESLKVNWRRRRYAQGGSTITQQLAKNLFLTPKKSLSRKLKEAVLALRLERELGKKRIFELYLNIAEWGPGIFGAEAASRFYFGKSASDLDLDEAVSLAAVLPSPLRHSPAREDRYVAWRKNWILKRLHRWGGIPEPVEPEPESTPPAWIQEEEADIADIPPAQTGTAQDLSRTAEPMPVTVQAQPVTGDLPSGVSPAAQ